MFGSSDFWDKSPSLFSKFWNWPHFTRAISKFWKIHWDNSFQIALPAITTTNTIKLFFSKITNTKRSLNLSKQLLFGFYVHSRNNNCAKFLLVSLFFTLSHSSPMHPFSTPRKHQKTVRLSDVFRGRESVHWERMGKNIWNALKLLSDRMKIAPNNCLVNVLMFYLLIFYFTCQSFWFGLFPYILWKEPTKKTLPYNFQCMNSCSKNNDLIDLVVYW